MIQASTWYMLAETSGSARGDFLVSFGGYSVCVRAIVAYNSSSLYILSNNISANTLISFRIRKLVSKQYVDIKVNKELDITYSIDNNNNWTALFGLSGIGQEICALNNINGDYSETGTVDYEDLLNKPSINGVTLIGDKKASDLNLQPAGDYADKQFETLFNKFFEYDEFHNAIKARLDFYTDTDKNISAGGFNNNISEIEVPKSYDELTEKPQINGQELLSGDNSLDKLGIQPKGNYATNEIVESQISAIIEKLNSHITDFETFVKELNTYFQFDSKNQAIKVLYDLYTDKGKNISASGYNNSGTEIIIPTSYPELTDKPKINGIEIVGNLTSKDLGLQLEGDYLTISDILNTVKQEDGTTKQYVKSELLPEVKGGNGIEILQTLSKTNISLLVDTNTFSFGETKELQINKIDGGVF